MPCLLVLSNFPNHATATAVATALVEEKLAACVNLIPGVTSIYQWNDTIQSESETTTLIKTTEATFPALKQRLQTLHPYEVPEIIALPVQAGLESYLSWVESEIKPATQQSHHRS